MKTIATKCCTVKKGNQIKIKPLLLNLNGIVFLSSVLSEDHL